MVIAAEDAVFSTPEMHHGIPPTLVMTALADVHRKALADLIYRGEPIDAATALSVGLVSQVAPMGGLEAACTALEGHLSSYDLHAIRVVKGFLGKPGHLDPESLSELADYTLATAFSRPR